MYKVLKKFLLPGKGTPAIGCSIAATALNATSDETCKINQVISNASQEVAPANNQFPTKMRPSELPIYSSYQPERTASKTNPVHERSSLEEAIGSIRKELWVIYDGYKIYQHKLMDILETGKAHTSESLHFLQEEATDIHRAGAIGIGGLAGIVFGLRGGFFRKLFYSSVAASGMAALCYPREAKEVTDLSLTYAKYYVTVGYNFVYGVKPEAFNFLPNPSTEDSKAASSGSVSPSEKSVAGKEAPKESAKAIRDQSNPADKDMYTNRQ